MTRHGQIWKDFCERHNVYRTWVPLFQTSSNGAVITKQIGKTNMRNILPRSEAMGSLVRHECEKLISDFDTKQFFFDGLIYIMVFQKDDEIIPLYIGKTETLGKGDGNISANIRSLERDTSKFARWGDNYEYHIGDLSAVALLGHDSRHIKQKYKGWAERLFETFPTNTPQLKKHVYFWAKAWSKTETGAWVDFGPTRLTFLEYQLIGLASSAFGEALVNREGHNRG